MCESKLEGGGEEKIRATCLWQEAYALSHGNTCKFYYIFFLDCILVFVTKMLLSIIVGKKLLHVSTQIFVGFVI